MTDGSSSNIDNPFISQEALMEGYARSRVEGFRMRTSHPKSSNLPDNPYAANNQEDAYHTVLKDYNFHGSATDQYNAEHPESRKTDFIFPSDPNTGWKVHLNVTPEHVKEASEYLKQNGYNHKYLSGGEIEDGKIFTVYIGSFKLVSELSKQMSQDIGHLLAKPKETSEVEFAPGVVGRFVAVNVLKGREINNTTVEEDFTQYGTCGFSLLKDEMNKLAEESQHKGEEGFEDKYNEMREEAEQKSFLALRKIFGNYFYADHIAHVPWD